MIGNPTAIGDGIASLERHAFHSSRTSVFYNSISISVVSTFMLNWKQITCKIKLEWLILIFKKQSCYAVSAQHLQIYQPQVLKIMHVLGGNWELAVNWNKIELMSFVYCSTSKSLLPKKKSQRLLIFTKTRNRCLNRTSATFDKSTMGLSERVFILPVTQNIKTVILLSFHYLFQRITLDIPKFFSFC